MNYSTDKPIYKEEQDLLGRSYFSNQLGKAIYEYNGKDGLVIGLFGKWGTGKTSAINMALSEINKLAKKGEHKPVIMRFDPWNYSDKDNLISLFFQSLKNKIDVQGNEDFKNKVGKALSDYSGAFDALSLVPVFGSGIASVLKTLAQVEGANMMRTPDLDETRKILEEALIKANNKIIIVIDDIDRLNNSQIRDVFQLVKQVADFPNVIYVLIMDREVVCKALKEVHNIDGNEYLEKIIQIPFEIPELSKSMINGIFFDRLNQIINNLTNGVVWDENYWSEVFRNCIEPYITTLRDVNRVINVFQFKYGMLYQETSFEDMVAITTLEVLEPELYKWIYNNKDVVCGVFKHSISSSGNNKLDYRKLYHDEFKKLGINPDLAISCVSTIFPSFAKNIDEYQYVFQSRFNIRGKMRVAHKEKFDLYFTFDLYNIKVSRSKINACIYELNREDLITVIEEINEQGDIVYFLEEIQSLLGEIPDKRLRLIVSVLIDLLGVFNGESSKVILSISAFDTALYLVNNIIKRLKTEEERYEIIRTALENVKKTGLGVVARIINRIELAYGRLAGNSEKMKEQIISLKHLEELEKIYVEKINTIAKTESFFDISEFRIAFYLWECFDKDGVVNYLKELFNNEVNKLKFICAMAIKWESTNGIGWCFTKTFSKYISQDEAYNMIQSFDKNKINVFTEIEQIKLASFILNYNKDELFYVNEKKALELVNKWKIERKE